MTMPYEYEKNIVAELKELAARYKAPSIYEMIDEVEEVYAKAEAFDEIVKLRDSYYTYSKRDSGALVALLNTKPFGREVSHLINKKRYKENE